MTTWGDGPVQPGPRPRLWPRGEELRAVLADQLAELIHGEPPEDPPAEEAPRDDP